MIFYGKKIFAYVLILAISVIYMIIMDSKLGITFFVVFFLAPIFSYIMSASPFYKLQITVSTESDMIKKKDVAHLYVTIKNRSILPLPFLKISFFAEQNFVPITDEHQYIALSGRQSKTISMIYKAEIWGTAQLGIAEISFLDYLGLYTFQQNVTSLHAQYDQTAHIYPLLVSPDLSGLMHQVFQNSTQDSDDAQEQERGLFSFPGYEHRNYIPGDSLKLVNWKLSAKRDIYMVREFETTGALKPIILLNPFRTPSEDSAQLLIQERIIEGMLSAAYDLAQQHLIFDVFYFIHGAWKKETIESIEDVFSLQYEFARFQYQDTPAFGAKLPFDTLLDDSRGGALLFFTCLFDHHLLAEISILPARDILPFVICSEKSMVDYAPLWLITEQYEFIPMGGVYRG